MPEKPRSEPEHGSVATQPALPEKVPPVVHGVGVWHKLHLWQMQPVRDVLLLLAFAGVLYIGYKASVVTVPVLLALAMAYLFEPVVKAVTSRGWVTRKGAAIGIIAGVGLLIVVPVVLGSAFGVIQAARAARVVSEGVGKVQDSLARPEDERLRSRVPSGAWRWVRDKIVELDQRPSVAAPERLATTPTPVEIVPAPIDTASEQPPVPATGMKSLSDSDEINSAARMALTWVRTHGVELSSTLSGMLLGSGKQAVGAAIGTVTGIGFAAFALGLTFFFFYFFSTGWARVVEFARDLIPSDRRARVEHVVLRMDRVIAGFVRGRVIICVILAGVLTLLYTAAGVPAALVLGPMVGLLFIVPFVHFIGVPIAIILMMLDPLSQGGTSGSAAWAAFQREWWWIVGAPIGIYIIAQLLDDWVLTPTIQGKNTDMSIPLILFASLAGGALAGIYGLLIAIPAAACVKILLDEIVWPKFREWAAGREKDFLPISRE